MNARLLLALGSTVLTLVLLEMGFAAFHVESDGFRHTRASRRWHEAHWKPINRYNMRDVEHDEAVLAETRRLFVVGDSFAAGAGVADYRERFANRLGERLGPDWSVVVLAQPGWNTLQEIRALERFPFDPDVVILSYYLNDVEDAARRHGRTFEVDLSVWPGWLSALVERSNLLNFAYWRLRRSRMGDVGRGYGDFVYGAFRDEATWEGHAAELGRFVDAARRRGADVVAVVFPHLFDLPGSADAVERVRGRFELADVPVLDVRELILAGKWEPDELVVGPVDPHPSPALHRAVADALLPLVSR